MKTMLLPVLALWVGCCPGGALAKQRPSLREPMAPPTPTGLPALQLLLPIMPGRPDGSSHHRGPRGWRQKKDCSQGCGGSSISETTGRGQRRPGSRRGHGHGPADPGTMEQAMPSLPASCLLAQAAIACGNAKMKHIPALTDPGLTTLYLAENEIAKIPAHTFLGLPNLEWLDLSKNKLDARGLHPGAFKNLTRLKRLNLDGNQLSTVPALPASLQELKLNDNHLQGLQHSSFRGLSKLLTLEVEGNQLHDGNISPLAFRPLGSLLYLRLDRNRLRTIPPGLPASLQELHLGANVIEEVTERTLNRSCSLSVLVLSNNRLQEDRLAPRAWIDLPKLETLDLSHNRLVHVPSFLPRGLRRLLLHHNHIERIPGYVFAHMKPGLEFLHLSYNSLRADGIHDVSFWGLRTSLAELLLDHNQLQAIPRGLLGLKGLQVLRLSHNKIRHVPLNSICDTRAAQDSNLISTRLENNFIDRRRIPPTAFSCIRAYHSVVLQPQQGEGESS
ncbi:extracellular matrix protein 2-like [Myotis daubentonii]|uniref:extracellular matrix protein 2-like n=1 Tax=Myotis daubentonii TaxID=98922 RepID=UPI00287378B5|nr:extracellular matrix protein 2-like [Myotis daubentonii]